MTNWIGSIPEQTSGAHRIVSARDRALCVAVAALSLFSGCAAPPPPPATTMVSIPGHRNDHASLASDDDAVALVWAATSDATGTNIFAASSTDAGRTFSAPVRVNAVDGEATVNGEQPPRVVFERGPDGQRAVVVLWTVKRAEGTVLLVARSTDGRTFGPASPLSGVDATGNRGWESMAAAPDGRVYALWLDHRDTVTAGSGQGAHQHQQGAGAKPAMDGVARAQRSQLFISTLDGHVPPTGIARGVCYCCKTALMTDGRGRVFAAWRHVYEGNRRDIAFTMSRDGGQSFDAPVRVSEDDWQLDGCPENGPALSLDRAGRVHVVWPTLVQGSGGETLALFHASSPDGRVFSPRQPLPTSGAASHPQMVASGDSLIVAWDELAAGKRRVKVARSAAAGDGPVAFAPVELDGDDTGSYPALAATSSHVVMAWTQGEGIAVQEVGGRR